MKKKRRYGKLNKVECQYRHVYATSDPNGNTTYRVYIIKFKVDATFGTEKEAAIYADKMRIKNGLKPVNILIPIISPPFANNV